jgi:hypothetical protein
VLKSEKVKFMKEQFVQLEKLILRVRELKESENQLKIGLESRESELRKLTETLESQKNIIEDLKYQLKTTKLANQIDNIDLEEKATLKKQFSEYIREIDQIIEFLEKKG